MVSSRHDQLRYRSLLTETLPYEVPVIFSNSKLYAATVRPPKDDSVQKEYEKLFSSGVPGTDPYHYRIRKDRGNYTDLAIVHPIWQLTMSEFYEVYAQSIVDYCKKSEFSLRRPTTISPMFSESELAKTPTLKKGIPHILPEEGVIDISSSASYFAYASFNLLSKFFASTEFLRAEKRFSRMRSLDVTKCFFSIYTHTITWAVKQRSFAKDNRNSYSFEARFDELMQKANSNETNGIVVGPEISRLFAEIIFQEIDKTLLKRLKRVHNRDYAIRRYVDDYFIFANSEMELDHIQATLSDCLREYKLFLNTSKTETSARPFVSKISLARNEISSVIADLKFSFDELATAEDSIELRKCTQRIREGVTAIRLIVAKYDVGFHTISGWLLSILRKTIFELVSAASRANSPERSDGFTSATLSILDVVFYVCALDIRVRTTYSLCQVMTALIGLKERTEGDDWDRIDHFASEELQALIKTILSRRAEEKLTDESVELCNLLICGSKFLGAHFVRLEGVRDALTTLVAANGERYFTFVSTKFCLLAGEDTSDLLEVLNKKVEDTLISANILELRKNSELFMLFCDFISSPDVSDKKKSDLIRKCLGGSCSKATAKKLAAYIGFVDWEGLQIEHLLARKELRPVYSWH